MALVILTRPVNTFLGSKPGLTFTNLPKLRIIRPAPMSSTRPKATSVTTSESRHRRNDLPLERVSVGLQHGRIHAADCASCETKEGMIDRIERTITLEGPLDAEQRAKLGEIADKCPVHRTLESEIEIRTVLEPAGDIAPEPQP